jgi:chemotaxis protein CheC
MKKNDLFTEEQLDYLSEMLNIGAGNASTALSHLLRCQVDMKLPGVDVLSPERAASALGDPALPVACLRMKMVGDMAGCLFFIVRDGEKARLAELAENALPGPKKDQPDPDHTLSILAEIGNILAGVYLTAIHDFCKLNVCHSVPVLAVDMVQSLLDESLALQSSADQMVILVSNEFVIGDGKVKTFLLIFPSRDSLKALVDSMAVASKMYGYE